MFDSHLKQEIAVLKTEKEDLQKQYKIVFDLLQQRQDEVVHLRREIAVLQSTVITPNPNEDIVESLRTVQRSIKDFISTLQDNICEEIDDLIDDLTPDEDEYEGED